MDVEYHQLKDYYDKVKHPMDLQTVHDKFDHRQYANAEEFRDDMLLIARNCISYNSPDTKVYQNAQKFVVCYLGWEESLNFNFLEML